MDQDLDLGSPASVFSPSPPLFVKQIQVDPLKNNISWHYPYTSSSYLLILRLVGVEIERQKD